MKIKSFFLWWKIDSVDLQKQIDEYEVLPFFQSSRKRSAALLVLSGVMTSIFIGLSDLNGAAILDVLIFFGLSIFVFLGHAWAIVLAMIVWTYEKFYLIVNGKPPIAQIIWWCGFMSQFYMAFIVERSRKAPRSSAINNESIFNEATGEDEIALGKQGYQSMYTKLRELKRLRDEGVITDGDFEYKKGELLKGFG